MELPELPSPDVWGEATHTQDAMRAYGIACAQAALEAAAARLDAVGCEHCAANVRAIQVQP